MINFDLFEYFGSEKLPSDSSDLLWLLACADPSIEFQIFPLARSTLINFLLELNLHEKVSTILLEFSERKISEGQFEAPVLYQFVI